MARNIQLEIDGRICKACSRCIAAKACKVRAIVQVDPGEAPYLDIQRCYDCRLCLPACPFDAVIMRRGSF